MIQPPPQRLGGGTAAAPGRHGLGLAAKRQLWLLRAAGKPERRSLLPGRLRLVTFDVFDTLLFLRTGSNAAVWTEVGRRAAAGGLPQLDPTGFGARRAAGVRHVARAGHPSLETIYDTMAEEMDLPAASSRYLAELELETLSDLLFAVQDRVKLVHRARSLSDGGALVFISDVHLPSTFLRGQLERFGYWQPRDTLWTSHEAGARKRDTGLYEHVLKDANVPAGSVLHIGDDELADGYAARWVGMRTRVYVGGAPNRFERRLDAHAGHRLDPAAVLAGAAREARLQLGPGDSDDVTAIRRVATSVVGPMLAAYGLWLLAKARENGLNSLYFVSRDGQVMHEVVAQLAQALHCNVDCRYLYGGRLAWQAASLAMDRDEEALRALVTQTLGRYTVVRPSGVAHRLGLSRSQVAELAGRTPSDDRELNAGERTELREQLLTTSGRELLHSAADEAFALASAYLSQEGLMDGQTVGFVDVGWEGNTVEALNRLLTANGAPLVQPFFLGCLTPRSDRIPACEAYLWDNRRPRSEARQCPPGGVGVVECVCSATHGPVVGYRVSAGIVNPRLAEEQSQAATSWPLHELRSGIRAFMERLLPEVRPEHLGGPDAGLVTDTLTALIVTPSRDEAHALGSCPREEDAQAHSTFPLARAFRLRDVLAVCQRGHGVGRNLSWPVAAYAQSPLAVSWLVRPLLSVRSRLGAARTSVRTRLPSMLLGGRHD